MNEWVVKHMFRGITIRRKLAQQVNTFYFCFKENTDPLDSFEQRVTSSDCVKRLSLATVLRADKNVKQINHLSNCLVNLSERSSSLDQ